MGSVVQTAPTSIRRDSLEFALSLSACLPAIRLAMSTRMFSTRRPAVMSPCRSIQRKLVISVSRRPPVRTGNAGRNLERIPGLKNWNVNLIKNVRISERFSTEFRTEFYNIWNTPQYGYFSVSPFTPGEGTIASNVSGSLAGRFLNPTFLEAGGRVIRYQLTVRF